MCASLQVCELAHVCEVAQVCELAPPSGGRLRVCVEEQQVVEQRVPAKPSENEHMPIDKHGTERTQANHHKSWPSAAALNPQWLAWGVCVCVLLVWATADHRSAGGAAVLGWGHCRVAQAKLGGVSGYSNAQPSAPTGLHILPAVGRHAK